jgi:cytosol alanyl aminopeptidase
VKTHILAAALFSLAIRHSHANDPNRLDPAIQPLSQGLALALDPKSDTFSGTARVEILFHVATNRFRFHAKEIDLGRATLDGSELKLKAGQADIIDAESADDISKGHHVFEISFTNNVNRDGTGIYRAESKGEAYLFTQMEPQDARRAFPCWDEPSFKIPWQLTLTVPSDVLAVANMPIAKITSSDKSKRIEFGRTPPLPSYLLAFGVGKFETTDVAGQLVPGSVYTVAGQKHLAQLAANEAPRLLSELEKYFSLPYPYPKLDHLAAPEFTFGAMENAGLITYRDTFLLFENGNIDYEQKRLLLEVIAHEMAHMWFGDLVTMQWWDDLWLNESFATWMSYKIAGRSHPDLRFEIKSYESVSAARSADTQPSVKAIRRPFKAGDNLMEAFDELSYNKGQAVLRMIEGWLGEETFREALRSYFEKHSWGNARAEDLWAAFARSGDSSLEETLRRYIEQPGIPEVTFKRLPNNRLEASQKRYRTVIGKSASEQMWHIPITLRYGGPDGERTARIILTNATSIFDVPNFEQARWVYPNAGESGYFTWNLPPDLTQALKQRASVPLSATERLGMLNALNLSVNAGATSADQLFAMLLEFASDPEPEVQQQVIASLTALYETHVTSDKQKHAFALLLRRTLRPILDSIGFEPKPAETPQIDPLRAQLLLALAMRGEDSEVIQFCQKSANAQLAQPRSVNGLVADASLMVAAWFGDANWLSSVHAAVAKADEPDLRARFLRATVPFRNESVAREALKYLLTDNVRATEVIPSIMRAAAVPELCPSIYYWIQDDYAALKKKLPEDFMSLLPSLFGAADESLLAKSRIFFLAAERATPLAEVEFKKAAEKVELRSALRKLNSDAVQRFLTTDQKR